MKKNSFLRLLFIGAVFLLSPSYSDVLDRIVAVVGDEVILKSEIDQLVENQKLSSRFEFNEDLFRKIILEELISNKVLYYTALRDSTVTVSDDEVQRILDTRISAIIEQVGSEKKFEEMYNTSVSDLKKQYRPEIRKSMFVEKLKNKYAQKVSVNKNEVDKFYDTYKDSLPPVKAYVNLSQLVVKFSDKALNETKTVDLLNGIKTRILNGEISFEDAAKKYSHDEASVIKGGNIGYTSRGDLVPEYERAAYNLSVNEISDPVRSQFGYHLIKLLEKSGEKINTSHILLIPEKNVESDSTAYGFALSIRDSVLNKIMTFEEAVRKYSSDEKTKYIAGSIGSLKIEEMDKKYSDIFDSAEIGFMSDPIKEKDGYYIYKVTDRKDNHEISMETDYNILKNMALERKRHEQLKKWIDELKKNVYIEIR